MADSPRMTEKATHEDLSMEEHSVARYMQYHISHNTHKKVMKTSTIRGVASTFRASKSWEADSGRKHKCAGSNKSCIEVIRKWLGLNRIVEGQYDSTMHGPGRIEQPSVDYSNTVYSFYHDMVRHPVRNSYNESFVTLVFSTHIRHPGKYCYIGSYCCIRIRYLGNSQDYKFLYSKPPFWPKLLSMT